MNRRNGTGHIKLAVLTTLIGVEPAFSIYSVIQVFDGTAAQSTFYDAGTGVLDLTVENNPLVALNDPFPLAGVVQNATLHLISAFDRVGSVSSAEYALFRGGSVSLTFEYDAGSGAQMFEISGRIQMLAAEWSNFGSDQSALDFYGAWYPEAANLPGSNVWPNNNLRCTIEGFVLIPSGALTWDPHAESLDTRTGVISSLFPEWGPLGGISVGDVDKDCDVDLQDFAWFTRCQVATGFDLLEVWDCLDTLDVDYNAIVEDLDLPSFVQVMTGPYIGPCLPRLASPGMGIVSRPHQPE